MNHGYPERLSTIGITEWFRIGEYERVQQVLGDLKELGVTELRTGFSWADWHTSRGQEWYRWLIPNLAREVNVLPCFHYTPPSLGVGFPGDSGVPSQGGLIWSTSGRADVDVDVDINCQQGQAAAG
jgi:hypothetical protein